MPQSSLPLLAALVAFACRPGTEREERPRPPAESVPPAAAPANAPSTAARVRPPDQFPGSLFADVERAVAPVQARLREMVLALRADSGTMRADSAFVRYRDSLVADLRAVNRMSNDRDLEDLFHLAWMPQPQQAAYLRSHGLPSDTVARAIADSLVVFLGSRSVWTYLGEGGPYFAISEQALSGSAGRFLSPAGREYLAFELLEQSRPSAADASLVIPWDEFGDRLAMADRFAAAHPASPFDADMRQARDRYLRLFLRGSASFDGRVPELTAQARANIEHFLAKYGSTPAGAVVRGYRDALAVQGYRGGKTLDEYLAGRPK